MNAPDRLSTLYDPFQLADTATYSFGVELAYCSKYLSSCGAILAVELCNWRR